MKLDILAFGAHPDDVELGCGGTLIKEVDAGRKVGVVDLTQGELGSRGTIYTRKEEATNASKIIGLSVRENLKLKDGFFEVDEHSLMSVIRVIRKYKPEVVISNSTKDRHPDHGRGMQLVERACFLSGLVRIETEVDGEKQEKWRPNLVLNYIQDQYIKPDVVIGVTEQMDRKMEAILAYKTQFYNPESNEPTTPISSKEFLDHLTGRAIQFGRAIGENYAEGFTCTRFLGVKDLSQLI